MTPRTIVGLLAGAMILGLSIFSMGRPSAQRPEDDIVRDRLQIILRFTGDLSQYYLVTFQKNFSEGFFIVDENFVSMFQTRTSDMRAVLRDLQKNESLVRPQLEGEAGFVRLRDALECRGCRIFGEQVKPSETPKTAASLANVLDYRVELLRIFIVKSRGSKLSRQDISNLEEHFHALRQIALFYEVDRRR